MLTRRVIEHNRVPLHEITEPQQPAPTVEPVGQGSLFPIDEDGFEWVVLHPDGTVTPGEPPQHKTVRLEDPASGVPRRLSVGRPITSRALDELYTTPVIVAQEQYLTGSSRSSGVVRF